MPAENGSVTPSAAAVATAASTALPPRRSTSMPIWLASASMLDTAPRWPTCSGTLPGGAPGAADAGAPAVSSAVAHDTARTLRRSRVLR